MKTQLRRVVILLGLGCLFCAGTETVAQRTLGGYKEASVDDAGVQEAAGFAAQAKGLALVAVKSAESQVVAGINYKLCLRLSAGEGAGEKEASAVVYQSLQREYELTSWQEENCSGEEIGSQGSTEGSGQASEEASQSSGESAGQDSGEASSSEEAGNPGNDASEH